MNKYTKKNYLLYVKNLKCGKNERPISFEKWKIVQPITDNMVGKVNQIIKSQNNK